MRTQCEIVNELIDVGAKGDSSPSVTHNQSFADVLLLKEDNADRLPTMTMEWNYSILDGTMGHLPDNLESAQYPYFSDIISDENGDFETHPVLEVEFEENHSSAGLSILFDGAYPEEIKVTWYGLDNKIISEVTFYPEDKYAVLNNNVENYRKIRIEFVSTKIPYRFLKILNIDYGIKLNWTGESIIKATITEELDPISSELSINTLDHTIYSADKSFNILNPQGIYKFFQPKQKIIVREKIDDELVEMGTFYLDTQSSLSETQISFHAIDALGILDKSQFKKGKIYEDVLAGDIIAEIMDSAGWEDYTVSSEIASVRMSGHIPICSHRQALQQVVFALRAVADCSRSDKIKIYRQSRNVTYRVKRDRIFIGGNIQVKNYISDVEITTHHYELKNEETKIFDGTLQEGLNEITFSQPSVISSLSAGTVIESGVNYAVIQMQSQGSCIVMGKQYEDRTSTYVTSDPYIPAGETRKSIQVPSATMVTKDNVYLLAESLFNYYSLRKQANKKILLNNEKVGEWIDIQSQQGMYVNGGIEKQVIDLTGGFISELSIIGYNTVDAYLYYTGKEIHTGEEIGVI